MSQQSKASFNPIWVGTSGSFANNTARAIVEATMRAFSLDIHDSVMFLLDHAYESFVISTSGTDTYTATLSPAITSYVNGQRVYLKFTNANTGAATINLNGLGAKSIKKSGGTDLAAGDISANQILCLVYDGTNFQVVGGGGGTSIVTSWKAPVKAATTANITLSGAQTIDGISIIAGDRVLVKDQTTGSQNGIYVCAAGAWARSTDADTANEVEGMAVTVQQGTSNADTSWLQTADGIVLGTTNLVFSQLGASVPDATSSVKGKAKLYSDLSASNTDGSVTQAGVKTEIDAVRNLMNIGIMGMSI